MWFAPGHPPPAPLRTFRETPYYLSCRVRVLPPYPSWTFAIIIFYSHVSCSLDSERYLLQTPLAFFFFPSSSYIVTFYFSFAQVVRQCWAFPGQGWIYSPHLPGCGLSWVYCICLSWSVTCLPLAEGSQLQSPFEDPSSSPFSSL